MIQSQKFRNIHLGNVIYEHSHVDYSLRMDNLSVTIPLKKMSNYDEIKWGIENGGYQSLKGLVEKMNFSWKE